MNGFISMYPAGLAAPGTATISYAVGQTVSPSATVTIGATGRVAIRPNAGQTHVIIDLVGYFGSSVQFGPNGYVAWVVGGDSGVALQHTTKASVVGPEPRICTTVAARSGIDLTVTVRCTDLSNNPRNTTFYLLLTG